MSELWARIHGWCVEYAPRSAECMLPPPGERELAAVAGTFPRPWPSDLVELYRVQGGASDTYDWSIVPLFGLLPLEEVESTADLMRGIWHDRDDLGDTGTDPELEQASTVAFAWPASYVPMGDSGSGDVLFVDTRPGPAFGCVREFLKIDADVGGVMWPSVTAMLADVAQALERGAAMKGWVASVESGVLVWDLVRA